MHVYDSRHVYLCMCPGTCVRAGDWAYVQVVCARTDCVLVCKRCEHGGQNVYLYVCMYVYLLVQLLVSEWMCVNVTFGALAFFSVTH